MSNLTVPLPGVPEQELLHPVHGEFKSSELANGFRVVSVETYTPGSVVGLVVRAGSRYEGSLPYGTAHTLARLAYQSTDRTTSFRRTVQIEGQTARFRASAQREQLRYVGELPRANVAEFIETTLADSLSPTIHEYEVDEVAETVQEDALTRPAHCKVLGALLREAFDDRTLGRPVVPNATWGLPTAEDLHTLVSATFKPARTALVGVGVDHQTLVSLAEKHLNSASGRYAVSGSTEAAAHQEAAHYTGGRIRVPCPSTKPLVAFGFSGKGIKGSQLLILSKLLHAKGATPFCEVFSDASVAGLIVNNADQEAAIAHLRSLSSVSDDAVRRAIALATAHAATSLETRVALFDLLAGHAFIPHLPSRQEIVDSVKNASVQDVKAALRTFLSSPPTIAAVGRVDNIVRTIF